MTADAQRPGVPDPVQSVALDRDGEERTVDNGRSVTAAFPAGRVIRSTLEPGWRWSRSVGQAIGAEYCTAPHLGYVISGRMVIRMRDGSEYPYGAGDAYSVSSDPHDAWVDGAERYVAIDVRPAES